MSSAGRTLIILLVIMMVATVPLTAECADAASNKDPVVPASEEINVYGYVTNLSDQEENTPLENVTVTLYSADKAIVQTVTGENPTTTDAEGRFDFDFVYESGATYYLTFDYPGYTVRSLPDLDMTYEDGYVSFQLRPNMVDAEGNYALAGSADGYHAFVMVITTGSVYGTVQGISEDSPFGLSGATVTIVSTDGMSYTTTTGTNGFFSIECPFGQYTMTVSCRGFQSSESVTVESGSGSAYSVTLVQNTSEFVFGLDVAHSMMLIGLVLLALIVGIVAALHAKYRNSDSEPILMNDLGDFTQQDEDDIRHP